MRLSRLVILFLALTVTCGLGAQDTHYTLHDYSPLSLNPANTGAFRGTIRVGGIYRGQWYSVNGINSPTAYLDATLPFAFRKQDWIGVGLSMVNDKANYTGMPVEGLGDVEPIFDITQNFFGFSAAYHLAFDKKRRNVLTIGAQYGSISYGAEVENSFAQAANIEFSGTFQSEDFNEFTSRTMGGGMNPGQGSQNDNQSENDINAGVKLMMVLDPAKDNVFEAGVSMYHLTGPERRSVYTRDTSNLTNPELVRQPNRTSDRRATIHAHARLDVEMNERWRFQPTAYFQQSSATRSLSLQAWGQRNLKEDLDLRLGLGYRTGDAAQVLVGLNFGNLRTALSYDVTLSQARAVTNYQGAFEVSAAYIFNIYKKPDVTPTILCPDI